MLSISTEKIKNGKENDVDATMSKTMEREMVDIMEREKVDRWK